MDKKPKLEVVKVLLKVTHTLLSGSTESKRRSIGFDTPA